MSIRVEAILFCDHIIDDRTGKKSLIGIFEAIGVSSFPARHSRMFLYVRFSGAPGERFAPTIRIDGPGGVLVDFTTPEIAVGPAGTIETSGDFVGLEFPAPGPYAVRILLSKNELRSARLHVNQLKPVPPSGEAIH